MRVGRGARDIAFAGLLFVASVATAQVSITGVTPNAGPTSGGTPITVTGANLSALPCFPICNPAALLIGGIAVPSPRRTRIRFWR